MNNKKNRQAGTYVIAAIVIAAFGMRFWDVAAVGSFVGDESQFIESAQQYFKDGRYQPGGWVHPPLNLFVTYAGLKIFGNNPYGWRMMNVLLGSLSVLALMVLARELFSDERIAWLAGVFFTIEPFHIILSRTNFMEVAPVFFFLIFLVGAVRYIKWGGHTMTWAGIPLGLAMAGKWYFFAPLLAVLIVAGMHVLLRTPAGERKRELLVYCSCLVTAAGVYLLTFYPWFSKGGTLSDFFSMQIDAYRELQSMNMEGFVNGYFTRSPSVPWEWFVRPIFYGQPFNLQEGWAQFFAIMNNAPVWLLTLPALLVLAYRGYRDGEQFSLFVILLFLCSYLQFVIVRRPVFFYSSLVVIPFVYLMVSYSMVYVLDGFRNGRRYFWVLAGAIITWGLYLYPFVTSRSVPVALYAPLLFFAGTH